MLQFKLRKCERQCEQLQTEKNHLISKLKEFQPVDDAHDSIIGINGTINESRVHALESELRIAKEVSVRLHNELELAEEKRWVLINVQTLLCKIMLLQILKAFAI